MADNKINIRKLEADLWESADLLRAGSKLTSSQYCMPVLALLFLRYAYSRFKMVEAELLKNRPSRGGRVMPVEPNDFAAKSLASTGITRPPRLGRFFSSSASTILKRL